MLLAAAGCTSSPTPTPPPSVAATTVAPAPPPLSQAPTVAAPPTLAAVTQPAADTSTPIGAYVTAPSEDGAPGASATMRITSAKWKTKFGPDDMKPKNGALLQLTVEYTGKTGKTIVNPGFDLTAKNAAGDSFNLAIDNSASMFSVQTITAGEKARGVVSFDAPRAPLIVKLAFGMTNTVATWQIPA